MQDRLKQISTLLKVALLLFSGAFLLFIFTIIVSINPPQKSIENNLISSVWAPNSVEMNLPEGEKGEMIKLGYDIINNTSEFIGPGAIAEKQFSGNNLACKNCHLESGKKIGSGSFIGVSNRFPQFRGRENKMGTLPERINGCLERSMNGSTMPENSHEMQSIIAYIDWLSENVPDNVQELYKGYKNINIPIRKADTIAGKKVFEVHCTPCHGFNGLGTKIAGSKTTKYLYPPLAGPDSYNDGAGMHRVITAAEFIKYNMPLGVNYDNPLLTDEEAYDVAAYINSLPRPEKANKEADFPDKKLKPVSTPYGPWTDSFPAEQHKYGPFQPIMKYYQDTYQIKKTK
ncbi:c-type cytochrome [Marinigracilibium pacificum]|uniref:C-type cytochrome n=1 Tax=Marinigracilibium pacificum TaxID=2729599 RepID=A0A848IZ59_9BACT|nr:c-type cytochrome [Marinigracilibium pacificum]NMM47580.1 c-type cytochrome [Marinigracilibium pacificum]